MAYQLIPHLAVEALHLTTMQAMFDTHKMLYDFGYRGSFSTTTSHDSQGVATESGRFDMVMEGNVPVTAALGDVILYRTTPAPAVVACLSNDDFTKTYQSV